MSDDPQQPVNDLEEQNETVMPLEETVSQRAAKDNQGKSRLIDEARQTIEKSRNLIDEIKKDRGV